MTDEQHVVLSGEVPRLDRADRGARLVEHLNDGASRDVETGFDGAAVAERDAAARVGADQAFFADGYHDLAAARKRSHGAGAAAQVAVRADGYALGNAPLDHVRTEGPGVEINLTLVHDRGAIAEIGAEPDAARIRNAHSRRNHVVRHARKLVHREDGQMIAPGACGGQARGYFRWVNGTLAGPGDRG